MRNRQQLHTLLRFHAARRVLCICCVYTDLAAAIFAVLTSRAALWPSRVSHFAALLNRETHGDGRANRVRRRLRLAQPANNNAM